MTTSTIKTLTRGAYDIQKLRIQMSNRIVANFKAKLGQKPSEKEETLEAEEKKLLVTIRASYDKIMDGLKQLPSPKKFKGDEVISTYTELSLLEQYVSLEKQESQHFRRLEHALSEYPIYTEFLKNVTGCGPAMSAVIVSEIDIHKSEYPTSIWRYAGLDVGDDGRGRSMRKEHLIDVEYADKDGEMVKRKSITFNPFLKTKLVGVLASSFLRQGKENTYAKIYYDYKHRLENMPEHTEKSKGHRHNMALRYMIKRFLVDLYNAWRELESLPVAPEYSEAKLGIKHKKAA